MVLYTLRHLSHYLFDHDPELARAFADHIDKFVHWSWIKILPVRRSEIGETFGHVASARRQPADAIFRTLFCFSRFQKI